MNIRVYRSAHTTPGGVVRKAKSPAIKPGFQYMDGLVSTGKQISLHNIKNNFLYLKKFSHKFYSHFFLACGQCAGNALFQNLAHFRQPANVGRTSPLNTVEGLVRNLRSARLWTRC
jgi:hypothetical protein